jgi:hypothetical protein
METYPKFFRGGHLYSVDQNTGTITDHNGIRKSVMALGNGIMDVGIDYHHNGIYGVGYPTGKLFYHDLNTGISVETWQTPQGIPIKNAGQITRNLVVDNEGRAWFFGGFALLGYSHHAKDTAMAMLPPGYIGWSGQFTAAAHSVTRDSIYIIDLGRQEVFRLRVKARALDYIAETTGKLLALRWDQEKLYYLDNGLKSYHVRTGQIQPYSVGGAGLSGVQQGSGNPIDKNGDIWMTRSDPTERGLLKIQLNDPCAICGTEVFDYGEPPVTVKKSEKYANKLELKIGPNPFTTSLQIRILMKNAPFGSAQGVKWQNAKLEIINLQGKILHFEFFNLKFSMGATACWNASNYPAGIYIIKVKTGKTVLASRVITLVK